jgi:hypothetical protein
MFVILIRTFHKRTITLIVWNWWIVRNYFFLFDFFFIFLTFRLINNLLAIGWLLFFRFLGCFIPILRFSSRVLDRRFNYFWSLSWSIHISISFRDYYLKTFRVRLAFAHKFDHIHSLSKLVYHFGLFLSFHCFINNFFLLLFEFVYNLLHIQRNYRLV